MTGYCSNSPVRCVNARTLIVLNEANNCCPECGLFLVPANSLSSSARMEQQFLQFSLGVMVFLILILVYVSYKIFL